MFSIFNRQEKHKNHFLRKYKGLYIGKNQFARKAHALRIQLLGIVICKNNSIPTYSEFILIQIFKSSDMC